MQDVLQDIDGHPVGLRSETNESGQTCEHVPRTQHPHVSTGLAHSDRDVVVRVIAACRQTCLVMGVHTLVAYTALAIVHAFRIAGKF